MHAVVAIPPINDFYFTPHRFSSLGAEVLCNILAGNGLKVSFENFPLYSNKGRSIDFAKGLEYLNQYIIHQEMGKLSYFTKYQRFGPSIEECAAIVASQSPHLCFISCFAYSYSIQTLELAGAIKRLQPQITVVVGGAGPTAYPLYFIKDPAIDFILAGESEVTVRSFINAFIYKSIRYEQVPNFYWKEKGDIKCSPLKKWTEPEDIKVVFSKPWIQKRTISFSTTLTRGCSKACRFCSNFITHGTTFRTAPLGTIKQAVNELSIPEHSDDSGIVFNFEDDNLLLDPNFFLQVIDILKDKYGKISLLAENGIDYSLLSTNIVDRLIGAGMAQFNISLASIDATILKKEHRSIELSHYQSIIRSIAKYKIPSITYFICGFKDDTKESVVNTLSFLYSQPTAIGISLYYAIPGIGNFENPATFDALPPYLCNGSSAYPWNGSLSTSTMITAFRLSRLCNLMKQNNHSSLEKEILALIQAERKLYTFIKTPKGCVITPVENSDNELVEMFFQSITVGVSL